MGRARGPAPRTDEQRQARRQTRERCRASRVNDVPEDVFEALRDARPTICEEPERIQRGFACLAWSAHLGHRRHRQFPECFSVHHEDLTARFGRRKFHGLNARHRLIEVVELGRAGRAGYTAAYRFLPDVEEAVRLHLRDGNDAGRAVSMIRHTGKRRRTLPPAIERESLRKTNSLWRDTNPVSLVPVDLGALAALDECLHEIPALDRPARGRALASLMLKPGMDVGKLINQLARIRCAARTDLGGPGVIVHQYRQTRTGRLSATGVNLQSARKVIKRAALNGLFAYDFENAHIEIFRQLAQREGLELETVAYYLAHKNEVRQALAERNGLSHEETKVCLIQLGYGARRSMREKDAIPKVIGSERARILYRDSLVLALQEDLRLGRATILKAWRCQRGRIVNAVGLPFKPRAGSDGTLKDTASMRLAHILQGEEARMLHAAVNAYRDDIVLLEHDGWTSRRGLDAAETERLIAAETGFQMRLDGRRIEAPRRPS